MCTSQARIYSRCMLHHNRDPIGRKKRLEPPCLTAARELVFFSLEIFEIFGLDVMIVLALYASFSSFRF